MIDRRRLFLGVASLGSLAVLRAMAGSIPPSGDYPVCIEDIMTVSARHFGTTVDAVRSLTPTGPEIRARQTAMYIAHRMTGQPYLDIAQRIGVRDATTILFAGRIVRANLQSDPVERRRVELLIKQIQCLGRIRCRSLPEHGRHVDDRVHTIASQNPGSGLFAHTAIDVTVDRCLPHHCVVEVCCGI